MTASVDDVMTKNPKTIGRDMLASEALEIPQLLEDNRR